MARLERDGGQYVAVLSFGLVPSITGTELRGVERLAAEVHRFEVLAGVVSDLVVARALLVENPGGNYDYDGVTQCLLGLEIGFAKPGAGAVETLQAAADLSRIWYEMRQPDLAAWHRHLSELRAARYDYYD